MKGLQWGQGEVPGCQEEMDKIKKCHLNARKLMFWKLKRRDDQIGTGWMRHSSAAASVLPARLPPLPATVLASDLPPNYFETACLHSELGLPLLQPSSCWRPAKPPTPQLVSASALGHHKDWCDVKGDLPWLGLCAVWLNLVLARVACILQKNQTHHSRRENSGLDQVRFSNGTKVKCVWNLLTVLN